MNRWMTMWTWFKQREWPKWLAQFSARPPRFDVSQVDAPLMSAAQITQLANELSQLAGPLSPSLLNSQAPRQGEQGSRFMGSGLEYEESRPYQLGDEIRRINWRMMAKTGNAYTKLYQEERQAKGVILLDHRQSMRFGTRSRLKADQALRAAGAYLWMAQQSSTPIEGVRMAENVVFTPTFEGRGTFEQLMARFTQPCPPMPMDQGGGIEPHINDVLIELSHRIQTGSSVVIISDFHDIDQKTVEILTALQPLAAIKAIWVQDPAELALPSHTTATLQSMVNGQQRSLSDPDTQKAYQAWAREAFAQKRAQLQTAGVTIKHVMSHAPLSELVEFNTALTSVGQGRG